MPIIIHALSRKLRKEWIFLKFGINEKYSTDSIWTPMMTHKPHFIQKKKKNQVSQNLSW